MRSAIRTFKGCRQRNAPIVIKTIHNPPTEKATATPAISGSSKKLQPPCSTGMAICLILNVLTRPIAGAGVVSEAVFDIWPSIECTTLEFDRSGKQQIVL